MLEITTAGRLGSSESIAIAKPVNINTTQPTINETKNKTAKIILKNNKKKSKIGHLWEYFLRIA